MNKFIRAIIIGITIPFWLPILIILIGVFLPIWMALIIIGLVEYGFINDPDLLRQIFGK